MSEIPEWVHVWRWNLDRSLLARQEANTRSKQKIPKRPPIKMRDFPQFENPGTDVLSQEEYETVREAWVAAGSPRMGSVAEVIKV